VERILHQTLPCLLSPAIRQHPRSIRKTTLTPDEVLCELAARLPAICRHAAHPFASPQPLRFLLLPQPFAPPVHQSFPLVDIPVGLGVAWESAAAAGCLTAGGGGGGGKQQRVRVKAISFRFTIHSTQRTFQHAQKLLTTGVALALRCCGSTKPSLPHLLTGPVAWGPARSLRSRPTITQASRGQDPFACARSKGFSDPSCTFQWHARLSCRICAHRGLW